MASITRDRGCLYYVPWLATACVCLAIAGLGVWAHYTKSAKDGTEDALSLLDIDAKNIDRVNPALVATAITYLVVAIMIYIMSLARSFIEAGHDATGITAGGATAFLVLNFPVNMAWWVVMTWIILVGMGDALWAAMVYIAKEAIRKAIESIGTFGAGTWLPSSSSACPGQCLNLTQFAFISSELQDACICDVQKLTDAQEAFKSVYKDMPGVMVGIWVMLLAGGWLLINFACQFSHTKRERELLQRLVQKAYV